ncbi:helix-turn-helix domain-containing protein [Sulfurospirillum sp. 1612]|uniref:helix-turn-helix domain-containing protein n=1 Tax=Sulfurospirillum sp. 1612 TaxID=3094835 RepID=UPI003FCD20C4
MIRSNTENYRIIRHLLNKGPITAAEACQVYISNNLRSRVTKLKEIGFDIITTPVPGKLYYLYAIDPLKIEENRELFRRELHG